MSLTSHLKDSGSPIYQFFRQQFPYTRSLVQECNREIAKTETIRPTSKIPYGTIGTALDYRIRYYFAETPLDKLVAGRTMLALEPEFYESFHEYLKGMLLNIQPVRQRLGQKQEQLLNRYCVVLALFEEVARTGLYSQSPLTLLASNPTVPEFLDVAEPQWIEDLSSLSWAFHDEHEDFLYQLAILNPTFEGSRDTGGADADLILDGCLTDIKTTINPKLKANWLYQLLGYVLLDYSDQHSIREVAIYLARQKKLVRWSLDGLISTLANDNIALSDLREHFRLVVQSKANGPLQIPEKKKQVAKKSDVPGKKKQATGEIEDTEAIEDFRLEEWIESAYQASILIDVSPIRIRELGLEGKIRMAEKNDKTFYYHTDLMNVARRRHGEQR